MMPVSPCAGQWAVGDGHFFDLFLFGSAERRTSPSSGRKVGREHRRARTPRRNVAHGGETRPPDFDASDPAAPAYRWARFDAEFDSAVAHGLQPIALVSELRSGRSWPGREALGTTNQAPPAEPFREGCGEALQRDVPGPPRSGTGARGLSRTSSSTSNCIAWAVEPSRPGGTATWRTRSRQGPRRGADNMVVAGNLDPSPRAREPSITPTGASFHSS